MYFKIAKYYNRCHLPPYLTILNSLGEEKCEGGEADLLLAPGQRLVQDGGLGPQHRGHEAARVGVHRGHNSVIRACHQAIIILPNSTDILCCGLLCKEQQLSVCLYLEIFLGINKLTFFMS